MLTLKNTTDDIQCEFASQMFDKYQIEAYGLKVCESDYDETETDQLSLLIDLKKSNFNCESTVPSVTILKYNK